MSRLEKNIYKKSKRKKYRLLFRALFILVMITNLIICVFIIEKSARDMLGSDAYILNSFIDDIKVNISKKINEIYTLNKK